MRTFLAFLSFFVFSSLALAGQTESRVQSNPVEKKSRFSLPIGIQFQSYSATSSLIRRAFGDRTFQIGVGPVYTPLQSANKLLIDYNIGYERNGEHRLLTIPLLAAYEWHFAQPTADNVPFFRVGVGVAYLDYLLDYGTFTRDDTTFVPAAAVEAGVILRKNLVASARYSFYGKTDGLDFSGLIFRLTYKFADLRF